MRNLYLLDKHQGHVKNNFGSQVPSKTCINLLVKSLKMLHSVLRLKIHKERYKIIFVIDDNPAGFLYCEWES